MSLVTTEDRGAGPPRRAEPPGEAQRDEPGAARRARRCAARGGGRRLRALRRAARRRAPSSPPASTSASSLSFAGDPSVLRPFRNVFLDCANLCEAMPKPVVCQIHRACFGGALEVALGCDLRIASDDSQLGLPEVKFGIIPDVGGSSRLPAVVGLGRAKELIMTAATIDAAEAHRIGLVNRVVAGRGAGGGHAGAGRRAAGELARRGRPRQARDGRLRPPRARADPGAGGLGAGVLRRGDARERARGRGSRARPRRSRLASASRPGRPRACGCPAAGRGSPARGARTRAAPPGRCRSRCPSPRASRRDPRSRCSRSRRPAPGSRRARRSSTRSCRSPTSSAASTFARPCPRVLWKCAVSCAVPGRCVAPQREQLTHLTRVGHPRGVAEADLLRARLVQTLRDLEHALGRDVALVGAAERRRDHALAAQPRLARARQHDLQPGERLLDRAVDVLAVVRLRGGQEHVDLVERLPAARARGPRAARARSPGRARSARAR